jgi:hypothetical protein
MTQVGLHLVLYEYKTLCLHPVKARIYGLRMYKNMAPTCRKVVQEDSENHSEELHIFALYQINVGT